MVNVHRLASKGLRSAATQRERPRKRVALSHVDVVLCLFETASHILTHDLKLNRFSTETTGKCKVFG